ncbi:MAG: hypothetical protein EBY24_15285 [Betaproteobacteria bacterium]|nr:hypothetical protein [Betaproteobacteria bacterium]
MPREQGDDFSHQLDFIRRRLFFFKQHIQVDRHFSDPIAFLFVLRCLLVLMLTCILTPKERYAWP